MWAKVPPLGVAAVRLWPRQTRRVVGMLPLRLQCCGGCRARQHLPVKMLCPLQAHQPLVTPPKRSVLPRYKFLDFFDIKAILNQPTGCHCTHLIVRCNYVTRSYKTPTRPTASQTSALNVDPSSQSSVTMTEARCPWTRLTARKQQRGLELQKGTVSSLCSFCP